MEEYLYCKSKDSGVKSWHDSSLSEYHNETLISMKATDYFIILNTSKEQ